MKEKKGQMGNEEKKIKGKKRKRERKDRIYEIRNLKLEYIVRKM